jgi:hypothetical protein
MRYWTALALLLVAFTSRCEGEPDDGFIAGQCGLRGERVECNIVADCQRYGISFNYCTLAGYCVHGFPGEWECDNTGSEWECFDDRICGGDGYCTYTCERHEDCSRGKYCDCWDGVFKYCAWWRCRDGACFDGTYPVEGNLMCAPATLEGECFGANNTCPDGYLKVSDNVGASLKSAACVRNQ